MGLFNKFLNKDKQIGKTSSLYIYSPVKGEVIDIEEVKDPIFSKKIMGDGFAVIPKDKEITAPVDGKVEFIAETKHGISLKTKEGLELFIHLGIDTVNLKGEGFRMKVKKGDVLKVGDPICQYDIDFIKNKGFDTTVVLVITSLGDFKNMKVDKTRNNVVEVY
ncbi:MAG: PTS glucose transporter subunit IIA [Peptoniphilaceae bacterium]|nr:PTS glucose transporter subunit IIA [Peptoniphilaceae bacterium]MDY6018963.1 PTS glucose transporter subunit IIA [Anaerococcus sp.]